MKFLLPLSFFLFSFLWTHAQRDTIHTENGWYLTPHGKLRVLVIFAEIDFDEHPEEDKQGSANWKPGELPTYADKFFDPFYEKPLEGTMSRYYDFMSMGDYQVLGDYLDYVVTVKESEVRDILNIFSGNLRREVARVINAHPEGFKTHHNLRLSDFDFWTDSRGSGDPKINEPDSSLDHVMVFFRNHPRLVGGYTNQGNFSPLFGYDTDTYSVQKASNTAEVIATHEYNHMLLGGNQFHATGGQHNQGGANYFLSFQGGYGMMGDANSYMRSCNAWDRNRLGWKHKEKALQISAVNDFGLEVDADIEARYSDETLTFWVRDFITYGDAIRIKLPHIPADKFQQWLWIENHQSERRNGCEFDNFLYAEEECREALPPGVHMYLQVDKNQREGREAFHGKHYGDYIKPIPASGFYDLVYTDSVYFNDCIAYGDMFAFERLPFFENALSGASELERVNHDYGKGNTNVADGKISMHEIRLNYLERINGELDKGLPALGKPRHVFQVNGVNELHLASNPSSSSVLTEVSYSKPLNEPRNNRAIYLNGLKIELVETRKNAENEALEDIKIKISFNHNRIEEDLRWAGDSIYIPPLQIGQEASLVVAKRKTLKLERGLTPTRMTEPDTVNGIFYFNDPTHLIVPKNGILRLEKRAKLVLREGSKLILKPGSKLILDKKASIISTSGTNVNQQIGASIQQHKKSRIVYR